MVHHYLEEQSDRDSDTSEHVKFHCTIEQPFREPTAEVLPPVAEETDAPPPSPKKKPACCPLQPPPELASSDLVEALPTILVGIGFAYAVGMLTGAFIFSTPVE